MKQRNWYLTFGTVISSIMLLYMAVGFFWTPYDPGDLSGADKLKGPTLAHPFGCDQLGRDVLSRTLDGAGTTLIIALGVLAMGFALGLLIGALCAFLFPSARFRTSRVAPAFSARTRLPLEVLGYLSLALLIACMVLLDGYSKWWYYGGIFLASLATACLMLALVNPLTSLGRIFALKPLVWLGERSYGLYLWHYPLLLLMNPLNRASALPWWACPLEWAAIVLVAALSYHYVENPIRRGCLGRYFQQWREGEETLGSLVRSHLAYVIATPVLLLAAVLVYALVPAPATLAEDEAYQQTAQGGSGYQEGSGGARKGTDGAILAGDPTTWKMVLVGDSVSLGAQENFLDTFPASYQDSLINRRMVDGVDVYTAYADQDWDAVIFALGTNVVETEDAAEDLVAAVGSDTVPILLINVRTPFPLQDMNNELIDAAVAGHGNVYLVDWYGASEGHSEYFGEDGTHLTPEGAQAYVDLILATLQGTA